MQLILYLFLIPFSLSVVVDNVSFLLVHLINIHLSYYFYTTQMNWQEKWTHLPVRKLENHHGFGRIQLTVFGSLTICHFVFDKKRWSAPCSPVLVLQYCCTLWGTEHTGCWGVERAESDFIFVGCHLCALGQRSSLSARLPRVRDFSEPCLPFNWHLHLLLIYPGQIVCS